MSNEGQFEYWNAARNWIDEQREHDEMLGPLGRLAIDALAPVPGERILDVGCGTGATTLELARAAGEAVGADISRLMLEAARERAAGVPGVSFIEADMQTHAFEPASFDGAFSRFGVMFFADTAAAFANIAGALAPGGRFAFVCWQGLDRQEWLQVPREAGGVDVEAGDDGPGPFRFADPEVLRRYLDEAGFVRVDIDGVERTMLLGGRGDLDAAMRFVVGSRVGREIADRGGPEAVERVRAALERFVTPRGVEIGCAVWVVRARCR